MTLNPILEKHRGAEQYDLFGVPEVMWSYVYDSDADDNGHSEGFWAVWADYAPDTRCSFDGDCRCKEMVMRGFDTEEEAATVAALLKAQARRVK